MLTSFSLSFFITHPSYLTSVKCVTHGNFQLINPYQSPMGQPPQPPNTCTSLLFLIFFSPFIYVHSSLSFILSIAASLSRFSPFNQPLPLLFLNFLFVFFLLTLASLSHLSLVSPPSFTASPFFSASSPFCSLYSLSSPFLPPLPSLLLCLSSS